MSNCRIGCGVHGAGTGVGGRLSLLANTPVTTTDQLAKTDVKYTPHRHKILSLFDGEWVDFSTGELSVAVPSTTVTPFDVFGYINSAGAPALETLDWASDTARATALVRNSLNGQWVLDGDETRKLLGTGRTTGVEGECEDSKVKRFLWNTYNPRPRKLYKHPADASWTLTDPDTWRQAAAAAANKVGVICGLPGGSWINLRNRMSIVPSANDYGSVGICEDNINGTSCDDWGWIFDGSRGKNDGLSVSLRKYVPLGYHYYAMTEIVGSLAGGASVTFYSTYSNGGKELIHSGLSGDIMA